MDRIAGYCMGCMSPLGRGETRCSRCSYDNAIPNPYGAIPAGTVMEGGYMVGKVVHRSDLIITYLGLYTAKNIKVYIEEFFPAPLASRDWDSYGVSVPEENRIRFKTLYSDIADRWKRLSRLDNRSVIKIREVCVSHGTICCITAYLPYHTLEMQLEEKGVYNWSEAKAAFMPLFTLVSNLHNQGLTHCGVSPENILVNRRGELILTGFALPELRTEGSGLTPELYAGYSAPEQYSKNLWQGEWTDVYSLGAVLYRVLTGRDPLPALDRAKKDTMPEAAALQPTLPGNVSEALVRALQPEKQKRFQSVDEFTAALLKESASNTAVFRPEPAQTEAKSASRATAVPNLKLTKTLMLAVLLVISLIANLIFGILAASSALTPPPPPVSVEPPPPVVELMEQSFAGTYLRTVQESNVQDGSYLLQTEYAYNEEYPADIVFDQSIKPGEPIPADRALTLYVSRGSQYLAMPYLIGSSQNFASKLLTDLGLSYTLTDDFNPESSGIEGTITACNKGFGARVDRVTDTVVLTVKRAPQTPLEP